MNIDACEGINAPNFNPMGDCAENYTGFLCASCVDGYTINKSYECNKCPSEVANIVRLALIFLVFITLVVFMIKSTMAGAADIKNVNSIFSKILMNHLQLIVLSATFEFNWPSAAYKFFSIPGPATSIGSELFSIDCFLIHSI